MNISENINTYIGDRTPEKRYTSFDYCFNYFQQFYEQDNIEGLASSENIQQSCFHLGFYLASWGMFRGKSFLLQKSLKHYEGIVFAISQLHKQYWSIDVDNYSSENIKLLLEIKKAVLNNIGTGKEKATATLVTKIMLGVFGNVPALDDNFCTAFSFSKYLSKNVLKEISIFYDKHRTELDEIKINTLDYHSGLETSRCYTKAKLIDMVGFIEGDRIAQVKKANRV